MFITDTPKLPVPTAVRCGHSPLQRLRGNMHKPQLYVFGSTVCAAAPSAGDMIVGRFAFGCHLGPVMGRTSHLVNLKLKDGTLKLVQASSIKVVMPLRFYVELMGTFGRRSVGALHEPPSRWETPKILILSLLLCP